MDVSRMAQRLSNHDRAVKAQQRQIVEKTLVCLACGQRNKPGASVIDVDEYDDARCICGYVWAVRIA